jgi:hypothetical protein
VRERERTLSRPTHLLRSIDARHGGAKSEPHCTTAIPTLHVSASRDFGEVVLRRAGVVDLLCRDIVNCCASRDGHDVGSFSGRVATNVGGRWIFDALFRVGIFGLAGCGPVLFFGFAVHDETGKGV